MKTESHAFKAIAHAHMAQDIFRRAMSRYTDASQMAARAIWLKTMESNATLGCDPHKSSFLAVCAAYTYLVAFGDSRASQSDIKNGRLADEAMLAEIGNYFER